MSEFNRVLVAVDLSPVSAGAFKVALGLAAKLGAELNVLHAVQMRARKMQPEELNDLEQLEDETLEEAETKLAEFIREHGAEGVETTSRVESGVPAAVINQVARDIGADMIIMGTHGRTGLKHLIMGSVAESVLKDASVPVLCIKG